MWSPDSNDNSGPDQSGYSVWGRLYDGSGKALSNEFIINTDTAGNQHLPKVVSRADGSFVALFVSATDGDAGPGTYGIYAQYFDAAGHKVGQQIQINQLNFGDQTEVDATFTEGGQLYVTGLILASATVAVRRSKAARSIWSRPRASLTTAPA